MTPLRAAVYVRVSSDKQHTANQLPEIEQLAKVRDFEIVKVYSEQMSALKTRPEYEHMMRDAKRGKFRVLIVWALDRFGRSMAGNLADVLELDRVGVQVLSVRETWMDSTGPVRNLLIAIISWVGEQERNRLIQRTKAGLEAARRRGSRLGRPRARLDHDQVLALRAEGKSLRDIAKMMNVGASTIQRHLRVLSA